MSPLKLFRLGCLTYFLALASGCKTHPPLPPEAQSVVDTCQAGWDSDVIDPIRYKVPPPWAYPLTRSLKEWTKPTPEETTALTTYKDLWVSCQTSLQALKPLSPGNTRELEKLNGARIKLIDNLIAGRLAYGDYNYRATTIAQAGMRYFLAHPNEEGSKFMAVQMAAQANPPVQAGRAPAYPPAPVERQGFCSHDGVFEECKQ